MVLVIVVVLVVRVPSGVVGVVRATLVVVDAALDVDPEVSASGGTAMSPVTTLPPHAGATDASAPIAAVARRTKRLFETGRDMGWPGEHGLRQIEERVIPSLLCAA
jgi:hypothetical protein